jgi:SanA protein
MAVSPLPPRGKILAVLKRFLKVILKILLILFGFLLLTIIVPRLVTGIYAHPRIYQLSDIPARRAAVVFGAGLWRDGSPTPILLDRVATAVELYRAGKVEKLLLSGDNRFIDYNEPAVMREVALSLGVPQDAIVLDYAGRRTYDTCYRARVIFGLTEAILVTQEFHLPRAIYTCDRLGLPSLGMASDLQRYRRSSVLYWHLRELLATVSAFWDLHLAHPRPVLGDPEPIFH